MTITRDENVSDEMVQLMAVFNRCSEGHDAYTVLNASNQMLACSIGFIAKERGCSLDEAKAFTRHIADLLLKTVVDNFGRVPQAGDIEVKPS